MSCFPGCVVASVTRRRLTAVLCRLRHTLDKMGSTDLPLVFPPPSLCTDNAAMIANVAISRIRRGRLDPITVMQRAKWSTEECEAEFEGEQGEGEAST